MANAILPWMGIKEESIRDHKGMWHLKHSKDNIENVMQ